MKKKIGRPKKWGENKKTTPTIVMEEKLWNELKIHALKEKTHASEIISKLVSGYLKKRKRKAG